MELQKSNDISIKRRESKNLKKDELTSTLFQRQRADKLLGELTKKFPIPQIQIAAPTAVITSENNSTTAISITTTKLEPEPEKVEINPKRIQKCLHRRKKSSILGMFF